MLGFRRHHLIIFLTNIIFMDFLFHPDVSDNEMLSPVPNRAIGGGARIAENRHCSVLLYCSTPIVVQWPSNWAPQKYWIPIGFQLDSNWIPLKFSSRACCGNVMIGGHLYITKKFFVTY
jgi:hypothetical protein